MKKLMLIFTRPSQDVYDDFSGKIQDNLLLRLSKNQCVYICKEQENQIIDLASEKDFVFAKGKDHLLLFRDKMVHDKKVFERIHQAWSDGGRS
ncbi:MAG: hypothetical protein AAF985_22170, partial [Bacteroidota bacterium]